MTDTFDLTIQVPADEWAYLQRRAGFLETLLVRVVRDRRHIQEWYSAEELAALRLPGRPHSRAGVTRKATAGRWPRRSAGLHTRGPFLYHVSVLPARAFDALMARILDLPEIETEMASIFELPLPPAPQAVLPENTAPAWVLPLMRLMKGEAQGDIGRAWKALPDHLPEGTPLPTVEEAALILVHFGIV